MRRIAYLRTILIFFCSVLTAVSQQSRDDGHLVITNLGPGLIMFTTSTGNVVASVGADGALLTGTPSTASTAEIRQFLASQTKSPRVYVVIASQDPSLSEGDAGWQAHGAFVAMQENALDRLGGHKMMGPAPPLPPRLVQLGVDRPRISFSDVLSFDLNDEAIHFVHQPGGSDDAQVLVHFHAANLLYFGEDLPGEGYPRIDVAHGGNVDGILKALGGWVSPKFRIIPVYGKVMTGPDVKAYCEMLASVRDRVLKLINEGKTEQQILDSHPSSDFDSRWGHGLVSPDAFVREIYEAVKANHASRNPARP